uniref:Ig-like domain-containing protein n=1 Tax=Anguilla anguilla TaxID=7936 RepID=A0A0E9SA99_ANGAN
MYQCEAVKGHERPFSNIHTIIVSADRPQAVIFTDPPASVMFTGEAVSLACDIRKGFGWRFPWSRNTQGRVESLYARSTESQQKHIQSVRQWRVPVSGRTRTKPCTPIFHRNDCVKCV